MASSKQRSDEVGGPFTAEEIRERREHSSFDVIEVDGRYYNEGIFVPQAQASYAKSVVFTAEAQVACEARELLWAAIASYYALFHLGLTLMLLLPSRLASPLRCRLVTCWKGGSTDPTYVIQHGHVPAFLRGCEDVALTATLRANLDHARRLREHVNYAPRVVWGSSTIIFRSLGHAPDEAIAITDALRTLLRESLLWASRATDWSWVRAVGVSGSLPQFLTASDLLYVRWCSPEVIDKARSLARNVPGQSQLWKHQ